MNTISEAQAKKYSLPLTRDYVRNWTRIEAIRELIQNAIDYGHGNLNAEVGQDFINIVSPGARLEPRTLLLGCTSKADDKDAIGSFGEGYKIALLVLAREGVDVTVFNSGVVWRPEFLPSEEFGEEVLTIIETVDVEWKPQGVTFQVRGLSPETIQTVRENTLQLQSEIGKFHRTRYGDILLERPGKLFVGGLFIGDTELAYGYNVAPEHIELERDRQTVNSFDLKLLTKQMWFQTERHDEIAALMQEGIEDLEYANFGTPEMVKDACYRAFVNKHPGAVVAANRAELEDLVKRGMTTVVQYGSAFASTVQNHADYKARTVIAAKKTPQAELQAFLEQNRGNMNRKMKESFRKLIAAAKDWK